MLEKGMRHSKELDQQLEAEVIQRAYATPEELHRAPEPTLLEKMTPTDLAKYNWLFSWRAFTRIVSLALLAALFFFVYSLGQFFVSGYQKGIGALSKPVNCDSALLAFFCTRDEK